MHYNSMAMDDTLANNTAKHNNSTSQQKSDDNNPQYNKNGSSLMLQKGRHWDTEFSTIAMSQYSTIR